MCLRWREYEKRRNVLQSKSKNKLSKKVLTTTEEKEEHEERKT